MSAPTNIDRKEEAEQKAKAYNLEAGTLKGCDCPKCRNKGFIYVVSGNTFAPDSPYIGTVVCDCMAIRRSKAQIERSGLLDLLGVYTLANWKTPRRWQADARETALRYIEAKKGWFLTAGNAGTGKTHLCTAICSELLNAGLETRYVLWRDMSVRAKAAVNDAEEYDKITEPLKRVKVLYIDDLFKTKAGVDPTPGDVNLAFEILNSRYNDRSKLTVISTEKSLDDLMNIDEAIGSRIYERSKGFFVDMSRGENWRLTR